VLPAGSRLRRSAEITDTLRAARGARGDGLLVIHAAASGDSPSGPARVAFVVPRTVGPAVTRNRVRRRLRHLVADRVSRLPGGSRMVVRVLPPAAAASSADLGRALDRALARGLPS
jgi:ribonuclease P protein component